MVILLAINNLFCILQAYVEFNHGNYVDSLYPKYDLMEAVRNPVSI